MTERPSPSRLRILGPGLLVAATGVGAGDLATGAFSGSQLGVAVLWAAVVGAALKFALNEGLARWQLATGETLLEGALLRLGKPVRWLFLLYLLPWSWFVGSALVNGCGVTTHAVLPIFDDPAEGKMVFGAAASAVALVLVWWGGYRLFERLMRLCIGMMFVTVLVTACWLAPAWGDVARGLVVPRIPDADGKGLTWTIALIGGVGGTLTVLCYGYWIREEGRDQPGDLRLCRIDLGVAYAMTALFGAAMVVIGSTLDLEGKGSTLLVTLGERLEESLGTTARWVFTIGAWGAVFSSWLGVLQSVPYLFADFCGLVQSGARAPVSTRSKAYRGYLLALALIPILGLGVSFREAQKAYAVIGAGFLPLLALALLLLNGRRAWVGEKMRNGVLAVVVLVAALVFFAIAGAVHVAGQF